MGGLTSWLRLFTHAEFESIVTKLTSNLQSSFTLLFASLVFYAAKDPEIIKKNYNKHLVFSAGGLGLVYISFVAIDSIFRSTVKSTRFFIELALLCGYASYWCVAVVVFGQLCLIAPSMTLVIVVVGATGLIINYPDGEIRGDVADQRLEKVIKLLGKRDPNDVLYNATMNAILQKPESPSTELLYQATLTASLKDSAVTDVTLPNQTMSDPKHRMGGVTSLFRLFTHAEFESIITKLTTTIQSSFPLLLACFIFYATKSSKILEDNQGLVLFAGRVGLVYTSSVSLDSIFRSKIKSIRCFAEISVLCGCVSYWCLVIVVFGPWSVLVLLANVAIVGVALWQFMKHHPEGKIRGDVADSRLNRVILRLGRKGDLNSHLHTATINAILHNPDNPETELLYQATLSASPEVLEVKDNKGNRVTDPILLGYEKPPIFFDGSTADGTDYAALASSKQAAVATDNTGAIGQEKTTAPLNPKTTRETGGVSIEGIDNDPKGKGIAKESHKSLVPPRKPDSTVLAPPKDGGKATATASGNSHSTDSSSNCNLRRRTTNKRATNEAAATATPSTAATATPSTAATTRSTPESNVYKNTRSRTSKGAGKA